MVKWKYQSCHGIPLKDPPLMAGLLWRRPRSHTGHKLKCTNVFIEQGADHAVHSKEEVYFQVDITPCYNMLNMEG